MVPPALELRDVCHRFGRRAALAGVDLAVADGSIHGFLGRNGAGKTTAIRLIFGLLRLCAGEIRVGGATVRGHPPAIFHTTAVLFEDFAAPAYLSGECFLRLRARSLGFSRRDAARRAGSWLERVGLGADGGRRTRTYSFGMRRRLGLAAALIGEPRLVVLDEPTNGLDPQGVLLVRDIVAAEHKKRGAAFLLSSHVLGEVERLCDAVSILEGGRIVRSGPIEELTATREPRWRLRVRPLARARAALASSTPARDIVAADGERDDLAAATLELTLEPEAAPEVVRALVAAQVDLFEMTARSRTLEDVFHEELAAAAARGGKIT